MKDGKTKDMRANRPGGRQESQPSDQPSDQSSDQQNAEPRPDRRDPGRPALNTICFARFERFRDTLLDLAEERADTMKQTAHGDPAGFDRGARALSSLMRANTLTEILRDKSARDIDIDDEKTRLRDATTVADPAEVERIRLASVRHLHNHLSTGTGAGVAKADEA